MITDREDIKARIDSGRKTILRGGSFLLDVFQKSSKFITAEEFLCLKDTYGIRLEDIMKLIHSHGFYFDEESVIDIFEKDMQYKKTMRPCHVGN